MKGQKGITLVALIITIIVMLILVGVTVSVVINSNVIGQAKTTTSDYKTKYEGEGKLDDKDFNIIINGTEQELDFDTVGN